MRMRIKAVVVTGVVVAAVCLTAVLAQACRYIPQTLEENLARASVAFIGTVDTVENGLAIFSVQHNIRGAAEGRFETEIGGSSCHIPFTAGQRWLYLGAGQPSGSVLLEDEFARLQTDNIAAVQAATGVKDAGVSHAMGGTVVDYCAPWDGSAFRIDLENNMSAVVNTNMPEEMPMPLLTYRLTPEARTGVALACDAAGGSCRHVAQAVLVISDITPDHVSGQLEISDGEHTSRYVFRVKRKHERVFCG